MDMHLRCRLFPDGTCLCDRTLSCDSMKQEVPAGQPVILPLGDSALIVRFGTRIDAAVNRRVLNLAMLIEERRIQGIVEAVPSFSSLTIHYDPLSVPRRVDPNGESESPAGAMTRVVRGILSEVPESCPWPERSIEIPACYGGEFGPDIEFVARHNRLTVEEVIEIHSSTTFVVQMLGFLPGFPYLGGLPETIAAPRLATPRARVPAGAVGIGGTQSGIYPIESPGGWRLIGRSPLRLFLPERDPPVLLRLGDTVRFRRLTIEEFHALEEES